MKVLFTQARPLMLAFAVAANAAGAVETRIPSVLRLEPLLLGDPGSSISPLRAALEAQSESLERLAISGAVPAAVAGKELESKRLHGGHAEAAAALVAANLMTGGRSAEAFFATRPGLANTRIAGLASLGVPGDPYRGYLADPNTVLGRLAQTALTDGATRWLFDGGKPGLELEGVEVDGRRIWTKFSGPRFMKGKAKLVDDLGRLTGPHPNIPGATLMIAGTGGHFPQLARAREMIGTLGEAGAGPRWLGDGVLDGGRRAGVVETVYGRTIADLMDDKRYGPREHALVDELIGRLARARVQVEHLEPQTIVIGRTLAHSRLRAFAMSPVELTTLEGLSEEEAFLRIDGQAAFAGLVFPPEDELPRRPPDVVYRPLGELLRAGVREPKAPLLQRLRKVVGR